MFYFFIDRTLAVHRERGTHPEAVDAEKMESSAIPVAITVTENRQKIQLLQRTTVHTMQQRESSVHHEPKYFYTIIKVLMYRSKPLVKASNGLICIY